MKNMTITALRNRKTLNSMISVKLTLRLIIQIISKMGRMMMIIPRIMSGINQKNIKSKSQKEKNKMKTKKTKRKQNGFIKRKERNEHKDKF